MFLNFKVQRNPLGTWLKRDSDSVSPGWGLRSSISNRLQMMLKLLVLKPCFEDKEYGTYGGTNP